jgi:hypothetical protein
LSVEQRRSLAEQARIEMKKRWWLNRNFREIPMGWVQEVIGFGGYHRGLDYEDRR